jgi:putative FmdB family regulatory protein
MPLYEYQCSKCGRVFEVMQKFSDAPLTTHEDCGGSLEKLLSAPAFHLKGSGWYVTDYGKGGKTSDSSSSKSESSSESKTETKSETKSESKSESSSTSTSDTKSA